MTDKNDPLQGFDPSDIIVGDKALEIDSSVPGGAIARKFPGF